MKSSIWIVVIATLLAEFIVLGGGIPRSATASLDEPPTETDEGDAIARVEDRPGTVMLRKLSEEEINRIRYLELRAFRLGTTDLPDRVTVKIPKETVDDFLLEMEGHKDFLGEQSRREFRKLTPPQKLHYIAKYLREAYADRVKIETDPEVLLEFRRRILPTVLRGCATSGCHNANYDEKTQFGLYKDPKRTPNKVYANFILLNELQYDGMPLINRTQPDNSLLLTYMLPEKEVKESMRHPGDVKLKPMYQSRAAPGYKRIERWIASLRQPPPDYGVSLIRPYTLPPMDDTEEP